MTRREKAGTIISRMASFAPEVLGFVGPFPVTNTIVNTAFVDAGLFASAYYVSKKFKQIPGIFQNIVELIIETFYEFIESVAHKHTLKIFPYVVSFFLFILLANWSGLIPGVGSIGFYETIDGKKELVPLMRNLTSDLNATFALALISLVATHMLALQAVGIGAYLSRYFSLNPINLFVGILEIISEITKVISLSFRLFGNIYAGEVVLVTISSLFAFIFPIPFMLLEIIVGLVQALVFALLTMVFMTVLMTPHHEESHTEKGVNH